MMLGSKGRDLLAPASGFLLALAALYVAGLLDSSQGRCTFILPGLDYPWLYGTVGAIGALTALPKYRMAITATRGSLGRFRAALIGYTLTMPGLVAVALVLDPNLSGRWLAYFFALAVTFDFLRSALQQDPVEADRPAERALRWGERLATYFDQAPQAPFVLAAIALLGLTFLALVSGPEIVAQRLANWAYGFLVLGVGVILLRYAAWPERWRAAFAARPVLPLLAFLGVTAGFGVLVRFDKDNQLLNLRRIGPIVEVLRAEAGSGDIIVVPFDDPDLSCYLRPFGRFVQGEESPKRVQATAARRVFLIERTTAFYPLGFWPYWLEATGDLESRVEPEDGDFVLLAYTLEDRPEDPAFEPVGADFGPLLLEKISAERTAHPRGAVAVAIDVRLMHPDGRDYQAQALLFDDEGHPVAEASMPLVDTEGRTTARWPEGNRATTYILVPVPPATPPLDYTLAVGFFDAETLQALGLRDGPGPRENRLRRVGTVQVEPAPGGAGDPYLGVRPTEGWVAINWEIAPGLVLDAYALDSRFGDPGDTRTLTLLWRATSRALPDDEIHLRVALEGEIISEMTGHPAHGRYPFSQWQAGEIVREHWQLVIPPGASPGTALLEVAVGESPPFPLATLGIREFERVFAAPPLANPVEATFEGVARLLGFDAAPLRLLPGDQLEVTLVWEAINEQPLDNRYKIFVHLLDGEGRLLAQDDREPVDWSRPTTGWVLGEILTDPHILSVADFEYEGPVTLVVGLYDSQTLERITVVETGKDLAVLPIALVVGETPA